MAARRSIVLLHGVQSSRLTWWRLARDLDDLGWDVQALDLVGHGDRRSPEGGTPTVEVLARDVAAQRPGPVDLVVGHSLGAIVALTLAGLIPGYGGAVVIEDPPGLAGPLSARDVAEDVERSVRAARSDPAETVEALLRENPCWSRIDAENAVASRCRLDVGPVTGLLRAATWDLQSLVANCPVPVHLLAASRDTALVDPDRAGLLRALPANRVWVVDSGHSIHRDRPALWLDRVLHVRREAV